MFIGLLLIIYCFILVPNEETKETLNPIGTREYLTKLEVEQTQRMKNGHTGIIRFTGEPVFAKNAYYYGLFSAMLHSYEERNFLRYLHLRTNYLETNPEEYIHDKKLFMDSPYPGKDREHLYHQTMLRYKDYLSNDHPITEALLFEKTGIQSLQKFLQTYGFYFFLLCAVYVSSNVVTRDRTHRTVLQGLPLSWYRQLNLKSFGAFLFTLLIIVCVLLIGFLALTFQFGVGQLDLHVPIMTAQQTFSIEEYGVMSIGKAIGLSLVAVPLLVFIFIRLCVIFGLLVKNEWIVFLLGILAIFSERLYPGRTTRDIAGVDISFFPQTYFEFGRVVTTEKSFLLNTETITMVKGFTVLLLTLVVLEVVVFVVSRIVTKRRFYKA